MCTVSVFTTIRVTWVFQPQYMGHLSQKKVWESHRRGMTGCSKSHGQTFLEVWPALQLEKADGGWDVAAAQLSTYTASIWGGNGPPRTPWSQECATSAMWCKAVFGEETEEVQWLFHRYLPALLFNPYSQGRMTSPQLLDTSYGFPRTGRPSCSLITDSGNTGIQRESEANR